MVAAGAVTVGGKTVGEAILSTVAVCKGVEVKTSGVFVTVWGVVTTAQMGPSISPTAASGPLTPISTVPFVSSPESTTLNSPL